MASEVKLQFVPFMSTVSPGFWYQLANKKLNLFKLDDSPCEISGSYTDTDPSTVSCRHSIEYSAFEVNDAPPNLYQISHGQLINKNTHEDFKSIDKNKMLEDLAEVIWQDIMSSKAIEEPSRLVRFCLLCFADLKKYHFFYWFGFPAFLHSTDNIKIMKSCILSEEKSAKCIESIRAALDQSGIAKKGFFMVSFRDGDEVAVHDLKDADVVISSKKKICFAYYDPSTLQKYPGWPLRNFLLLIYKHWASQLDGNIDVLCLRRKMGKGIVDISQSLWMCLSISGDPVPLQRPQEWVATGWEKNKNNKLCPRFVNLAETMDPKKLAESAVNLNLKLMRWRLAPSIDLEKISETSCLILGAGTLGCNVARGLLGWGVKKITLLDNGKVSFSNPVRQTLYEFSDCSATGGRPKAVAAAEKLEKIFPGVQSQGVVLDIPMPGHPVNSNQRTIDKAKRDTETLIKLIDDHDIVFLLMDSRESRWLPTVVAAAKRKIVINAALGFDSYLVMRHGVIHPSDDQGASSSEPKLGCYFCNDVVAPGNSTKDRTLDQQCTVSRPGLSMIASALAVELFVSVLQHSEGPQHVPDREGDGQANSRAECPLGIVPHQIRGFLAHYQTLLPTTYSFSKCTACSQMVIDLFEKDGIQFLLEVFNSPSTYLEDITGLTQLHQETALAECEILEFSDDESI